MNSTLNNQTMSKSMNGLNVGNFDELTTENFSATTLSSTNLSVSGTLTLPDDSILDSYLSPNVALLDRLTTQTFAGNIDFSSNTFFRKNVEFLGMPSGQNLFQAYKNTGIGNAGHILANGEGNLLYYDSTAALTKWKLDTSGNLLCNDITSNVIVANTGVFNGTGVQRMRVQTDSAFKYWEYTANGTYQNYILSGNINYRNSINGNLETCGDITVYNGTKIPFVGSSAPDLSRLVLGKSLIGYYNIGITAYNWSISNTGLITTTGGITATASQSISFGSNNPTMGASNINYGTAALRVGTGGTYSQKSIAIGTTSFGTAIQSVAIGDQALNASGSTANYSVAIGVNSLTLATGERNTAIGTDSLPLLTGTGNGANTAIGNLTGTKLTSGVNNLFLGVGSGAGITSGNNNLIVGASMFASVSPDTGTTIENNICVGSNAMGYIKNGCAANTAIGSYALYSEIGYGGGSTIAIGGDAGVRSQGSYCTFIGTGATVDVANSSYNYSMALGAGATVSASNQIKIGTSSQNTIIDGDLEVGGNFSIIGTVGLGGTTIFGDIECVNIDATGDIYTVGDVYATTIALDNAVEVTNYVDIQSTLGYLMFSGINAGIRVGVSSTFLTDTTANNINIGNSSVALGGENCIIGYNAKGGTTGLGGALKGQGTVLVGALADSEGEYSTGVGHNVTAYKEGVAIGRNANSNFAEGIAMGKNALGGDRSLAIGSGAQATNVQGISIGHTCLANGQQAVGIGEGVIASSLQVVALGAEAEATNTQCIAIGYQAKTANDDGISIGATSRANGNQAVALGFGATANFSNAVSIGNGVAATAVNEFRLGNTSNKILLKQIYYPFEISPTNITATGGLPASPYYGTYRLASAGAITITLPVIVTGMEGIVLRFRKTTTPLASGISVTCSAGNTYFPFNSITATAAGVVTAFIGGGQTQMSACVISATQWAVITA
jgi:hypothetical protein